jgi:hypothetical protein
MMPAPTPNGQSARYVIVPGFFLSTLLLRIWGVSTWFWLLGDQIRDWAIALGPFSQLPLVGPATHVSGYTVGPAFYWILWLIRVVVGPWFDNLPHAGGIGQAIVQSGADALLLVAIWQRTRSLLIALVTMALVTTSAYDLALAPLVWNPVMGSTIAKIALALVLLDWDRGSAWRVAATAAVAWIAVHAYTGAIFVAVSVFVALLLDPVLSRNWRAAGRQAALVALAVLLLQIPYAAHQALNRFSDRSMGAVTDSVTRILTGQAAPEVSKSIAGLTDAVTFIQIAPWHAPLVLWVLVACGLSVGAAYRRDPRLLCMTLMPPLMAVAGYAFFLAGLDNYYYLSLMPPVVLTVVLALTLPGVAPADRWTRPAAAVLLAITLVLVPSRVRFASKLHRMPEYAAIVTASRAMVNRHQPLRGVETSFPLEPTSDPAFVYRILGGPIDPASEWIGVIEPDGGVRYRRADGS